MIKDLLQTYNVSIDTLKEVFPEDAAKLNAVIAAHSKELNDEQKKELDSLEMSLVEKYYDKDNDLLSYPNLKPYEEPYKKEEKEELTAEDAIGNQEEENLESSPEDYLGEENPDNYLTDLEEIITPAKPIPDNKVDSIVYENFHIDTFQKLHTFLNIAKDKEIKYFEAYDNLEENNLVQKDKLTKSGEDVYKLYSGLFKKNTHPAWFVHFTDKDVFPNGDFQSGIRNTTYIIVGDYSFLVGDGVFIRTPHNYNDNYNARYKSLEDKIEEYFASKMFKPCELIGLNIKEVVDKNIGSVVFEIGDNYAFVNSLVYNYVQNKFSGDFSFEGVVLPKERKAVIYVKQGEESVAFFQTKMIRPKSAGVTHVNHSSTKLPDKIKKGFPATTVQIAYSDFLLRDKTPTRFLTIKDYREIIWGLRALENKNPDIKSEYQETIADLKILSELKFGMEETDAIRNLAKGGPIVLNEVKEGDKLYGYSKSGKLVQVSIFDIKRVGLTTWVATKANDGEVISGDLSSFKTNEE